MKRIFLLLAALCALALLVPGIVNARVIDFTLYREWTVPGFGSEVHASSVVDTTNFHAAAGDTIRAILPNGDWLKEYYGQINFRTTGNDSTIIEDGVTILTNAQLRFYGNTRIGRPGGRVVKVTATGMRAYDSWTGGNIDKRAGILTINNLAAHNLEVTGFGDWMQSAGFLVARGATVLICDTKTRNYMGLRAPFTADVDLPKSGEISIRTVRCVFQDSVVTVSLDMDEGVIYSDEGSQFGSLNAGVGFDRFPENLPASEYDAFTTSYLQTYGRFTATFDGSTMAQPVVDYLLKLWKPTDPNPLQRYVARYNAMRRVIQERVKVLEPMPPVDYDNDGVVGLEDFFLFAAAFGQSATGDATKFDLDKDGMVGLGDFFIFAENFGKSARKRTSASKPVAVSPDDLARFLAVAAKTPALLPAIEFFLPRELYPEFYARLENRLPKEFSLAQNFPNPFNPATTITYALPKVAEVRLVVYNLAGQVVRTLVLGKQEAGRYQAAWNATDERGSSVATGLYFYRLTTGTFNETRRMLLVK